MIYTGNAQKDIETRAMEKLAFTPIDIAAAGSAASIALPAAVNTYRQSFGNLPDDTPDTPFMRRNKDGGGTIAAMGRTLVKSGVGAGLLALPFAAGTHYLARKGILPGLADGGGLPDSLDRTIYTTVGGLLGGGVGAGLGGAYGVASEALRDNPGEHIIF